LRTSPKRLSNPTAVVRSPPTIQNRYALDPGAATATIQMPNPIMPTEIRYANAVSMPISRSPIGSDAATPSEVVDLTHLIPHLLEHLLHLMQFDRRGLARPLQYSAIIAHSAPPIMTTHASETVTSQILRIVRPRITRSKKTPPGSKYDVPAVVF
jgi:hypothetical protein